MQLQLTKKRMIKGVSCLDKIKLAREILLEALSDTRAVEEITSEKALLQVINQLAKIILENS